MTKGRQLAVNTLVVGIGRFVTAFASFLVLPIYTKHLSPDEYGAVDLVTVYLALLLPFLTLRLEIAIFRWLVDARKKVSQAGSVIASVYSVVSYCLLIFTALFWTINLFVSLPYASYVYAYIVLSALFLVSVQVSRGFGRTSVFTISNILKGVGSAIVGAALVALADMGVEGVLTGLIVGDILGIAYVTVKLKLLQFLKHRGDPELRKSMIKFALPMIPDGLSWFGVFSGTKLIISAAIGLAANGIYAIVGKFVTMFMSVYDVFGITWQESASVHIDSEDRDVFFTRVINSALLLFGALASVYLSALAVVFPYLVDDTFSQAYIYIPLLLGGFLIYIAGRLVGSIYIAKKMTKSMMKTTVTAAVVSLAATALLIEHIGLWAPVISTSVAYLILAIYRFVDIRRHGVSIHIRYVDVFSIAVLYLGTCWTYYNIDNLAGQLLVFVLICAISLAINRDSIKVFKQMIKSKSRA